jgi:hypothetical protein
LPSSKHRIPMNNGALAWGGRIIQNYLTSLLETVSIV